MTCYPDSENLNSFTMTKRDKAPSSGQIFLMDYHDKVKTCLFFILFHIPGFHIQLAYHLIFFSSKKMQGEEKTPFEASHGIPWKTHSHGTTVQARISELGCPAKIASSGRPGGRRGWRGLLGRPSSSSFSKKPAQYNSRAKQRWPSAALCMLNWEGAAGEGGTSKNK